MGLFTVSFDCKPHCSIYAAYSRAHPVNPLRVWGRGKEATFQNNDNMWRDSLNKFGQVNISKCMLIWPMAFCLFETLVVVQTPKNVLQLRQNARMRAPSTSGFLRGILLGGESPRAVSPGPPCVTSHSQNKSYAVVAATYDL